MPAWLQAAWRLRRTLSQPQSGVRSRPSSDHNRGSTPAGPHRGCVLEARAIRHATACLALLLGSATPGCGAVRLDAAERSRLSGAPVIHSVHYQPIRRLEVATLGGGVEVWQHLTGTSPWIELEDPVAGVEARFLAGLQREMGLTNLQRFARPLPSQHVPAVAVDPEVLRGVFRDGLVLDFESTAWRLAFVSRNLFNAAKTTYGLDFAVRARLVRLPDKVVLWEESCVRTNEEAHRPLDEIMAAGAALLRARRDEIAASCAEELLGLFLGRATRSTWSGRVEPASR
jgi:hypothetical protein